MILTHSLTTHQTKTSIPSHSVHTPPVDSNINSEDIVYNFVEKGLTA